jgi:hypothetical protein
MRALHCGQHLLCGEAAQAGSSADRHQRPLSLRVRDVPNNACLCEREPVAGSLFLSLSLRLSSLCLCFSQLVDGDEMAAVLASHRR